MIPEKMIFNCYSLSVEALQNLIKASKNEDLWDAMESQDVWWKFEDEEEYPEAFTEFAKYVLALLDVIPLHSHKHIINVILCKLASCTSWKYFFHVFGTGYYVNTNHSMSPKW